ncbi:hypothetical protein BRC86_04575 [Halobacteriales archaeon QS_3_64_16]|nr:MAG: hypothetical protein BRC86_04575 [Halobacteriales archaeon QS_3_64_16]
MAGEPTGEDAFCVPVRGIAVDSETRCSHYRTDWDVIAITLPCCETFFPCFECHETYCEHEAERWPPDRFDERAILCGVCDSVLAIETYLASEHRCPHCEAAFNPGCTNHWDRYFRVESE